MKDSKKTITNISKARAKAFNEHNAKGIAAYFAENAALMAPGQRVVFGKKEVADYYQAIFDEYKVRLDSYYEEVEIHGNLAYGRGEATVILTPRKGGPTSTSTSKYLNILKKQANGTWLTTHDIWNANE